MSAITTDRPTEGGEIDERDRRALLEEFVVVPQAEDLYRVYSGLGSEASGEGAYVVDTREGACTCPDFRYRGVECKHLRRARLESGQCDTDALAAAIERGLVDVDDRLAALTARRAELVRLRRALARFDDA